MYTAGGVFTCPDKRDARGKGKEAFQPAWIDSRAKSDAWGERSAGGFPLPATEWEDKGRESHAWVGAEASSG